MGTGTPGSDMSAITTNPMATTTAAGVGAITSARRPAVAGAAIPAEVTVPVEATIPVEVTIPAGAVIPAGAAVVLGAVAAILLRRFLAGRADAA